MRPVFGTSNAGLFLSAIFDFAYMVFKEGKNI